MSDFGGPTQRGYACIRVNRVRKEITVDYRFKEMIDTTNAAGPERIRGLHTGSAVKSPPAAQETQDTRVWSLGREDPLEEEVAAAPAFLLGQSHRQGSLARFTERQTLRSTDAGKIILFC